MTMNTATTGPVTVNGVNVGQLQELIDTVEQDPSFAKTQFRARNKWLSGGLNRSQIKGFYAVCAEDHDANGNFRATRRRAPDHDRTRYRTQPG